MPLSNSFAHPITFRYRVQKFTVHRRKRKRKMKSEKESERKGESRDEEARKNGERRLEIADVRIVLENSAIRAIMRSSVHAKGFPTGIFQSYEGSYASTDVIVLCGKRSRQKKRKNRKKKKKKTLLIYILIYSEYRIEIIEINTVRRG